MKGIVFTLDAIFSLIIASAAISILLYFQFVPQAPYVLKAVDAQNLLGLLFTTNVSYLSSSLPIASEMANQQAGSFAGWDDLRGGASSSGSSPYGPSAPFVSYIFNANSVITTGVVADYGKLYFGSGSTLYALNSTGRLSWTNSSGSLIEAAPVLYKNQVIYWTASKMVSLNANNGSVVWTANSPGSTTPSAPLIVSNGELIFAGMNGNLYVMYANNGTLMSTNTLGIGTIREVIIAKDSIGAASASTLDLLTNDQGVATQGLLWNWTHGATIVSLDAAGNMILFGNGVKAAGRFVNGTADWLYDTGSQVVGISSLGTNMIYQSSNSVTELSLPGPNEKWNVPISTSIYGTGVTGSNPVIGNNTVYTLWSNNYLLAENMSTGAVLWSTKIPYSGVYSNMSLAFGRLYVSAGNNLIAYGACDQSSTSSVLQAAASLYMNGQGSCADYLLNSVETMSNYTLASGSNVISGISLATFAATNSYVISGGNFTIPFEVTLSFWAYPRTRTGAQEDMVNTLPAYLMVGMNSNNNIVFDPGTGSTTTTSNAIPFNAWSFITLEAFASGSNTIYSLYINGAPTLSGTLSQATVASFKSLMFSNTTVPYVGTLANVQIYKALLSQQQLGILYQEGIQGGPLSNANVISWYPLDGDTNDYGSQTNTGYTVGVSYVNSNYVPTGLTNSYEVGRASTIVNVQNYSTGVSGLYNIGVDEWR